MQQTGWKSAGCFLPTLQLVVTHSIFEQSGVKLMMARKSKLVSYFKHSAKAMNILHKHQTALEGEDDVVVPHNNLLHGCESTMEQLLSYAFEVATTKARNT